MISNRIKRIKPSATMEIGTKTKKMIAEGIDVIRFDVGQPDFPVPEHIIEEINKALKEGFTKYTPVQGIPELREAISEKMKKDNRLDYDPEREILVTVGGKGALYKAVLAITNPGDEILLPDPRWVSYKAMVQLADGKAVMVPTKEEDEFKLMPETIKERITERTRMMIINSPNNPTGSVLGKKDLEEIAEICIENDLIVISDEIYEKIIYNQPHHSIASIDGMRKRTITINGFSKAYAMTGLRLGYACAPENIIKNMTKIQGQTVSHPTSIVQKAGVVALRGPQDCVFEMVSEYKKRRDVIVKRLNEIKGVSCIKPKGAFYAFPNFSVHDKNSSSFANRLLEGAKVAVIHGSAFGEHGEGFLRFSYATSMDNIEKGLDRIEKFLLKT